MEWLWFWYLSSWRYCLIQYVEILWKQEGPITNPTRWSVALPKHRGVGATCFTSRSPLERTAMPTVHLVMWPQLGYQWFTHILLPKLECLLGFVSLVAASRSPSRFEKVSKFACETPLWKSSSQFFATVIWTSKMGSVGWRKTAGKWNSDFKLTDAFTKK